MSAPVMAAARWSTNGDLIADVARLGYLRREWRTLDPTYGRGKWWTKWRPDTLVRHDLKLDGVDFRHLPYSWEFDAVAFDPPYKLNGTPTAEVDERYGVDVVRTWQDRHELIRQGIRECARVLKPGGVLLVKCQNQVCSGQVRWQVDEFSYFGQDRCGLQKVDQFDHVGAGRPQPSRTRADGSPSPQVHARHNASTLIVFRRPDRAAPELFEAAS